MWWLAAPVAIWGAKKLYDAVTDDDTSSSSYSYSDRDEQKIKAEDKARCEQEKKEKAQRKRRLIKQLSEKTNNDLMSIKNDFLSSNAEFSINNADILREFSGTQITDELSALNALSSLSKNKKVVLRTSLNNFDQTNNEVEELIELEILLLDALERTK